VKAKITELEAGLPSKTLADGSFSQVRIIPFYDRSELIKETLGTLEEALSLEILITIIVVVLMLLNLRSSLLLSGMLPLAVLMCFIAMKYFGVDANIVALSGIAIAIGTMVDMGIVMTESMVRRLEEAPDSESSFTSIFEASKEVASAVITAVASTVFSFLPVFTMEAAEGKLFKPLAYTKTFALLAAVFLAISILPPLAHSLFSLKLRQKGLNYLFYAALIVGGTASFAGFSTDLGIILIGIGLAGALSFWAKDRYEAYRKEISWGENILYALVICFQLSKSWMPLGVSQSLFINFIFLTSIIGLLIGFFYFLIYSYEHILGFLLKVKWIFLGLIGLLIYTGIQIYQETGEEFMPSLDEGSFLLMPTSMPHAGMEENIKNLRLLDMAVTAIPEVESVVGKAGRVESALDPAPLSMYENVILYKSEYKTDEDGQRLRFKVDGNGKYIEDAKGELIPDENGQYFRQWRDHIQSPDDIWKEILNKTRLPGVTSAPKLQPIETRLIMLQTGMRAPMGIKVKGPDLKSIESFGRKLEQELKQVEGVKTAAVFADRIIGKPYLLLDIDRQAISRHGLSVMEVQEYIQTAVGGMSMSNTVEGRERYSIRVRYPRELRDDPESLSRIFIPSKKGAQIPLGELVEIRYEQGPQSIKSEDGFLTSYVLFDRESEYAEVEVVEAAEKHLQEQIEDGLLEVPAGISYRFAGTYEQQVRANDRLMIVLPLALVLIFLILYLQFRSALISLMVFSGVFIAFAGGFILIGLYAQPWFLNFELFGSSMRDLFQVESINLSIAVWVGFLALFGIATDDGVLIATFLRDSFRERKPNSIQEIREAVIAGGKRRVRPALMTTATTLLALLPILTSTGRGADIMLPMAIPSFGGMLLQMLSMFTVPILFAIWKEATFNAENNE
ncbi:MAG: efflux RND transporter permease subunit, partial [Bacteroidota bacterium]